MEAVLLDVNETLYPLEPLRARLRAAGLAAADLEPWFRAVLVDGIAAAAAGRFAPFPELARHHLATLLRARGLPADEPVETIMAGFDEVTPHDDVAPALERLHDAGVAAAPFTNGTAALARGLLERAGIDHLVADIWDVGQVGLWKPRREAYEWACDQWQLAPQQVALIAVHPWDVQGAMAAGLAGAWVDRDGTSAWPAAFPAPTMTGTSLVEVVDALLAT